MQTARVIFAAMAVAASGLMTISVAEARHYRHAHADYDFSNAACGPVSPPSTLYVYPEANWEAFFRRHVYRYGPLVTCAQAAANTNVISVRY